MRLELWSPPRQELKMMTDAWMAERMGADWRSFWDPQPEAYEVKSVLGWPDRCFLMTAGELPQLSTETMTEQLYRDTWGTALLDSGRELLRKYVRERCEHTELTFVGPGLNGVTMEAMKGLCDALEGWRIGVTVNEACALSPEKSCGGWFVPESRGMSAPEKAGLRSAATACRPGVGCRYCGLRGTTKCLSSGNWKY